MRTRLLLLIAVSMLPPATRASAERLGYPPEEFVARRAALAERLERKGIILLMGKTMPAVVGRFVQDNDFYYFTGNQDVNAAMLMDAAAGHAVLFLPRQDASELRSDGPNWLLDPEAAKRWGFESIQPLDMLAEIMARWRGAGGPQPLWVRLSESDEVSDGRRDKALQLGRRFKHPFAVASEEALRVEVLRQRYPFYEMKDLTPVVDRLRVIKSPREIEILKTNGRISAEAVTKAIQATRAGRFEYEIEAEATYHHLRNGVQVSGYPAIVGAGANGLVWHYNDNGKRLAAGDTVVMDYGGSLDYQVIDITRTWPVSGVFDEVQLKAYQCVLEAQKAIIAAMKPGATRAQTREISKAVFKKWGFDDKNAGGAGHFVGMAVHDVGDPNLPFEPGMVIAVEPILEIKEKNLHVRIEDTVLLTNGEPIVLTAGAPKEVNELVALIPKGGTR
jgi:Xaa-Pro aminopeptidase